MSPEHLSPVSREESFSSDPQWWQTATKQEIAALLGVDPQTISPQALQKIRELATTAKISLYLPPLALNIIKRNPNLPTRSR